MATRTLRIAYVLLAGMLIGRSGLGVETTSPTITGARSSPLRGETPGTMRQCSYSLSPASATLDQNGGQVTVSVITSATCGWAVVNFTDWVIAQPTSAVGPATVLVTVARNPGPPRSATIVIAGLSFVITQEIVELMPDLAVASADIVFDQLKGSVVVTATVHNTGDAAASQVVVAFASEGAEFGRVTIPSIAAGSSETATATWKLKGRKTGRIIAVTIDPDTAIPESNELNNAATAVLTLR